MTRFFIRGRRGKRAYIFRSSVETKFLKIHDFKNAFRLYVALFLTLNLLKDAFLTHVLHDNFDDSRAVFPAVLPATQGIR